MHGPTPSACQAAPAPPPTFGAPPKLQLHSGLLGQRAQRVSVAHCCLLLANAKRLQLLGRHTGFAHHAQSRGQLQGAAQHAKQG